MEAEEWSAVVVSNRRRAVGSERAQAARPGTAPQALPELVRSSHTSARLLLDITPEVKPFEPSDRVRLEVAF